MRVNIKKCTFGQKTVDCLGHKVSNGTVAPDPKKAPAVREQTLPKNVSEMGGFLGLVGYYWKFIFNSSKLAAPVTQRTQYDQTIWFNLS